MARGEVRRAAGQPLQPYRQGRGSFRAADRVRFHAEPLRRRRRQQGSPASARTKPAATGRQGAPSTGIRGWLAGAGRWIGDKYDAATGAVGDFVHQTGQAAAELWDLASHSDLSLEGGNLVLDTDLDELMDVMPASVQGALQLDRASANRVRVVIDPKVALLTSDAITVQGLDTASLKTGEVRLEWIGR